MKTGTVRGRLAALMLVGASILSLGSAAEARQSDAQIKQAIIKASIASYSGNCPCPYNVMRNGRSCGGRSAYSRPGGEAPKCYAGDVTKAEVAAYRGR